MHISHVDILRLLGPASINWDFEELRRVRSRGGRIRSFVRVWVRRHLIEEFESVDVPESYDQVEVKIWGTASASEPKGTAAQRAASYGLMLFGLLPELAKAHGLDTVIERLGPVCLDWEFMALKTHQPSANLVRCEVEITCNSSVLSPDGKGKGTVARVDSGEVPVRTTYPEDEALFAAIRNCCLWMGIIPDDADVKHDYNYSAEYIEPPARRNASLLARFMRKVAAMPTALLK